jgi:hypothetical protein
MRIHKLYIVLGMLLAFGMFFELAAHADEANQSTKITFSAPIQIPGQVLPAGTYIFRLAQPDDNLNVVEITNVDRSVVYATLQTIPEERTNATEHTAITLAEPKSGKPVLVTWFYPADSTGHEFVYSKQQEQKIAQDQQQTFLGNGSIAEAEAAGE